MDSRTKVEVLEQLPPKTREMLILGRDTLERSLTRHISDYVQVLSNLHVSYPLVKFFVYAYRFVGAQIFQSRFVLLLYQRVKLLVYGSLALGDY